MIPDTQQRLAKAVSELRDLVVRFERLSICLTRVPETLSARHNSRSRAMRRISRNPTNRLRRS
jgi:hypothetical protein